MKLLIPFLMVCASAIAQDNVHGQFQREVQKTRDDAKYLEDLRSKPNNIKTVSGTGVDQQAVNELAERFSKKPTPKREMTAQEKAQARQEAIEQAEYEAEQEEWYRKDAIVQERIDWLAGKWLNRGLGLTEEEAKFLATQCVSNDSEDDKISLDNDYGNAVRAMATYQQIKNSGTFDEVLEQIVEMRPATFISLDALDLLDKRFPAQKNTTDIARFGVLILYYGGSFGGSKPHIALYEKTKNIGGKAQWNKALNEFLRLEKLYPQQTVNMVKMTEANPMVYIANQYWEKKDEKNAAIWFKKMFYTRFGDLSESARFFFLNPKLDGTSLEQWNQIAAYHQVSVRKVLEAAANIDMNNIVTLSWYNEREYLYNANLGFQKRNFPKFLNQLADEGDADAMNAMAVRYAAEKEGKKSMALPMLQKAAAAGSVWANLNLFFATDWKLKDYDESHRDQAWKNLQAYFEKASPEDLYEGGRAIMEYDYPFKQNIDWKMRKYGHELLEKSAREGYQPAINVLAWRDKK